MNDQPTYQFFTNEDFKKILATQGTIQTDVALAANNLKWIIENYQNQCKEIAKLEATCQALNEKYNSLRGDVLKYVGIGIGVMTVITLVISAINLGILRLPWT
jgi:SMC interacting uncharacterized protein involved in chromosome segregation